MKKMLVILLVISFSALASEIEVSVRGMVCSMCAQGIQKKMSAEPAVNKIEVDMDKKLVKLQLKDGMDLSDDMITRIIQEAGYNVGEIKRK